MRLPNPFRRPLPGFPRSRSIAWPAWSLGAIAATLAALAACAAAEDPAPQAAAADVAVAAASDNPPARRAPPVTPMKLISNRVPAFASSTYFPARYANDGDYNTKWRSSGMPATLAYDLSSVLPAQRRTVLLVWYNDDSYAFDHTLIGQPGYNNAGAYTIEVNPAPGGGKPPATGWIVAASRSGNTLHSFEHVVDFAGNNWIRANFSASDGSPQNTDVSINMDVYDASAGVTDGWFFAGDSITDNCMSHGDVGGEDAANPAAQLSLPSGSFGNQVNALAGTTPAQENGAIGGWASANAVPKLGGWLATFPGRFVTLNFGTNDAAQGVTPATFSATFAALVKIVHAAGKVAVVPTIPYSSDSQHTALPALNARIRKLYASQPDVVAGPDLWTLFKDSPKLLSSDGVHPNAQGCAAYRAAWARFAAERVYSPPH
jgi:lysophospholipase L1-like esterase